VDGPYWQALFEVSNDLVCFGHMSGLLVRVMTAGPDEIRQPVVPIIAASLVAHDDVGVSMAFGGDRIAHHFIRAYQS
jgi:hypothetical protein